MQARAMPASQAGEDRTGQNAASPPTRGETEQNAAAPRAAPLPKPATAENKRARRPAGSGTRTAGKKKRGRKKKKKQYALGCRLMLAGVEAGALLGAGVLALMVTLGYAAATLSGTSLLYHRLPFALTVCGIIGAGTLLLRLWWELRVRLNGLHALSPPLLALTLAAAAGFLAQQPLFVPPLAQFRLLVGGKAEMQGATLRHQIFAAYRRLDREEMGRMLTRSRLYRADIEAAASAFALDPDLLMGLAAAESSFYPRDSADGGQGLFQITSVPAGAQQAAQQSLGAGALDLADQRHNTFVAAATLKSYLAQMRGSVILGLLAYNIGPENGGLRDIMKRYGATDFITIQPYLQEKPRNYPVRVLCFALAFRVQRTAGSLLPYEEELNAIRVQHIGIPGL